MKRALCSLLTLVLLCSLATPARAAETRFTDVPDGTWYSDAVYDMVDRGVVKGVGNDKFDPDGKVTASQYGTMVARLFFADELANEKATGAWWVPAMEVCRKNGMLDNVTALAAYRNGTWGSAADAVMNRNDVAMMTYNYMKATNNLPSESAVDTAKAGITDFSSIPARYRIAVATVFAGGYLKGVGGGKFDGNGTLTRAQAVTVLYRLVSDIEAGGISTGSDPSGLKDGYLTNGKPITEANIQEMLEELKVEYPAGMKWDNGVSYGSPAVRAFGYSAGYGCAGFAFMLSDRLFGDSPDTNKYTKHQRFNEIKVGDILWNKNSSTGLDHKIVITEVDGDQFYGCSGNVNGKVSWTTDTGNISDYYDTSSSLSRESCIFSRYTAPASSTGSTGGQTQHSPNDVVCGICGWVIQKDGSTDVDCNGGNAIKNCPKCFKFFACYQCMNSQAFKDHVAHCHG